MRQISEEMITAINKCIILGVVSELSALEIRDNSYREFKQLVNRLSSAGKAIQRYFETHPNCSVELRGKFKSEFLGGKNVLISEILTLLTNMSEDGCESVLTSIQNAINEKSPEVELRDFLLTNRIKKN